MKSGLVTYSDFLPFPISVLSVLTIARVPILPVNRGGGLAERKVYMDVILGAGVDAFCNAIGEEGRMAGLAWVSDPRFR